MRQEGRKKGKEEYFLEMQTKVEKQKEQKEQ